MGVGRYLLGLYKAWIKFENNLIWNIQTVWKNLIWARFACSVDVAIDRMWKFLSCLKF